MSQRRFSEKNVKAWGTPSLVIIDGGKGQLDAALTARNQLGHESLPFIGLAKREEQIVIDYKRSSVSVSKAKLEELGGRMEASERFILISLPHSSHIVKLLQRIRDESHRFAVSYHSVLKRKKQTASALEDIPGIGPATRKKIIRHFGSVRAAVNASEEDLSALVGSKKAKSIRQHYK